MALVRSITIGLVVDPKGMAAGLKTAEVQLARFQKSTLALGASMGGAFAAAQAAIAAVTAATKSAVDFLTDAVTSAADFESAMTGLSKATDLEGDALAGMGDALKALSLELSGVKLDDLMKIATTGAKQGVATDQLVEYTRGVAMLSTAMDDVPAETIADQIGKINVVFDLGVKGAMQLGSAIDKLADSGVSSAGDIMNVTQRISGTAKAMGLTADQAVSMATTLLDTGTEAEAAAGSLNALMMAMVQVENHKNFAKVLGINVEQFSKMMKAKPIAAMQQFLGAVKGLDASSQLDVFGAIGIEGIRSASNLQKMAQQADFLTKYLGSAADEFQTLNQITQSYNKTADDARSRWIQFDNAVELFKITLGNAILPALLDFLKSANEGVKNLTKAFEANQGAVTDWVKGLVPDAARVVGVFEQIGVAIASVADAITSASIAWQTMQLAMSMQQARQANFLLKVQNAAAWLEKRTKGGVQPDTQQAINTLTTELKTAEESVDSLLATLGPAKAAPGLAEGLKKTFDQIRAGIQRAGQEMDQVQDKAKAFVGPPRLEPLKPPVPAGRALPQGFFEKKGDKGQPQLAAAAIVGTAEGYQAQVNALLSGERRVEPMRDLVDLGKREVDILANILTETKKKVAPLLPAAMPVLKLFGIGP